MRFSKVFFPLALAASAIAADPSSTLDAFKEKSKEVIVLVYSIASAPVDTDPAVRSKSHVYNSPPLLTFYRKLLMNWMNSPR